MDDNPRAADVQPGEIIAYTPTTPPDADPVALFVIAPQHEPERGRVLMLGGHFPSGVFVRVHRAHLPERHPVTIMNTRWVTTPGASVLHVQGEGESATVCGQTNTADVVFGDDPSRMFSLTPVCRTCTYRATRQAAETERADPAPFFYDLP